MAHCHPFRFRWLVFTAATFDLRGRGRLGIASTAQVSMTGEAVW
jgi:hypothetical protein